MELLKAVAGTLSASSASWFTPTVLFCFLNLMIGTIYITSNLRSHHKPPPQHHHLEDDDNPPQLVRVPSLLDRVRSIDLSLYRSDHHNHNGEEHNPTQLVRAPSLLDRVRSIDFSVYRSDHHDQDGEEHNPAQLVRASSLLDRLRSFNFALHRSEHTDPPRPATHHDDPTHEEARHHVARSISEGPPARAAPVVRLRKSASEKAGAEAEEADEIDRRRPATTREGNQTASFGEDEAVDEKADDFINRFKQQLKLQRLDSLLRYKEMLNRGS